ncbi:autotransporter outer membrane beta-barrel domain-containing protein [Devosia epidermidihirudinis]|uniref:autotransporter outer membrane beta-barrel domain-containing protein n=1 Tax=Devosia epidermidihirudinis TaxID=1293439 RepID=UPI0006967578|nr:autotransporter outer membrane beta-barrel domain-containing protein [Devosia epidermidihirudinis]
MTNPGSPLPFLPRCGLLMTVAPLALMLASATASGLDVELTGDTNPANAADVTDSTDLDIGIIGAGELHIKDGGVLNNYQGSIGTKAGGLGTVTVTGKDGLGNASTWNNAYFLYVGQEGEGTLSILDGGVVTGTRGYIGADAGSVGTVTVSGHEASWNNFGDVVVGQYGDGTLNILAGGLVSSETGYIGGSAGGVGVVTVSGVDGQGNASTWTHEYDLHIGDEGRGTLNVTQGGKVVTSGRIDVGSAAPNGDGVFGHGDIVISDGGTVSSYSATLGVEGYGEALLTSGGSWTVTDQFTIGSYARGVLNVENGASVTSHQGYVGAGPTGDGTVVVKGTGSSWEMIGSSLTVGNHGVGVVSVDDGGRVFAKGGVYLGASDVSAVGTLNVLGTSSSRGVVETSGFAGGRGTANVTLDGGIIRATGDNANFFRNYGAQKITLGTSGGIFDTNGFNIDIAPEITGAGGLTKDGLGTLTLTGSNSYGGGTTISAGTLQLGNGGTSGSISGNVANSGIVAFNRSDLVTFGGTIAGTGGVQQVGAGHTTLTGDNSGLTGVSGIYNGILTVKDVLGGTLEVRGGRLQGTGQVGSTTNFAGGTIAPGNSIGVLTVAGDYTSSGGRLEIETVLGGNGSAADLLLITGNSLLGLAPTLVSVVNLGGVGAATTDGIKVVEVQGALSDANAFVLDGLAIGGAYRYELKQHDIATGSDGNWYLRNSGALSPTVPTLENYPVALLGMIDLPTLRQRVGQSDANQQGFVTRIEGAAGHYQASTSTAGAAFDSSMFLAQVGLSGRLVESADGSLSAGLTAQYSRQSANVFSAFGDGSNSTEGFGLGASLTWRDQAGSYVDLQGQIARFSTDLNAAGYALVQGNAGTGFAAGIEVGHEFALDESWSLTPQAQLNYASVGFDAFTDHFGADVSLRNGASLKGRLGFAVDYRTDWQDAEGRAAATKLYGVTNLTYEFLDGTSVAVSGTDLTFASQKLGAELGFGGTLDLADGTHALHGEVLGTTSFEGSYAAKGTVGFVSKF